MTDPQPDAPAPAAPLVMPPDEFEAVKSVAAALDRARIGSAPPAKAAPDRVQEDAAKARTLITGALLGELSRRLLDYENAIEWNTTCLSCSAVLDSSIRETWRRERAEARLAAVRTVLLEGGQDAATVRRRALAIIGSEEESRG